MAAPGQQQCLMYSTNVRADRMREPVGSHNLQQHVGSGACGFCGGTACTPYLTANGQAGKPLGCAAYVKLSSKLCEKDRAGCNNHLMECPAGCKAVMWKYSLEAHFTAKHQQQQQQQLEQRQPFIMGPKEQRHMDKVSKGPC